MRVYLALGLVAVLVLGGIVWWMQVPSTSAPSAENTAGDDIALAPEVEAVLAQKAALLVNLAADAETVNAVRASNEQSITLTESDIQRLDAEWQNAPAPTPFITGLLTNPTARRLVAFQNGYPEFKEIFIADARGLNVGQTDKTSDYYQADEEWWVLSFNDGRGRILHGAIEFDESSQTEAISIYVPVLDNGRAIGVMKGVLDLSAISAAL